MASLLDQLQTMASQVRFEAGTNFYWSPEKQLISYVAAGIKQPPGQWALIHEVAHVLLSHRTYHSDFELLQLEVAAWEQAQVMAEQLKLTIDPEHIQDCLDTYRDWLHERSTCPTCSTVSLQLDSHIYRCHNCYTKWHVSTSRFCRPYRLRKTSAKQKSPELPQTIFGVSA